MPFRVYGNVLAVHLRRQYVPVNITVQLPSGYEMPYQFARNSTTRRSTVDASLDVRLLAENENKSA